ncbi:hypothetical protein [Frigidibacter sp. SD6-1]|uniref:hypothetical protein n=1 Tax=Frigidibacter sp. SD6-1 TaxID=3032581 RepID=UPI0024E03E68|nr:hypothetical protein [Frigidibacter sp. SD6-1]
MPELVRLYIRHVIIGFLLGAAFTALLLWLNVANLWHLVTATREGPLAVLMLVVFNTIVFSGVQFAYAVMQMAERPGGAGGTKAPVALTEPAPVAAQKTSGGNRSDRAGVNFPRA